MCLGYTLIQILGSTASILAAWLRRTHARDVGVRLVRARAGNGLRDTLASDIPALTHIYIYIYRFTHRFLSIYTTLKMEETRRALRTSE